MVMAPSTLKMVLAPLVVLLTIVMLTAHGSPVNRRDSEMDSAVEGVQKYLESSGFPKMTRGEVLEFLDDFSRNSRVSRSDNTAAAGEKQQMAVATDHVITTTTHKIDQSSAAGPGDKQTRPMIPEGESPLNYGYPMSVLGGQTASSTTTFTPSPTTTSPSPPPTTTSSPPTTTSSPPTTQMMFVTVPNATWQQLGGRSAQVQPQSPLKKTVGPSVDLNAYSKFKKIPEARNVKIDDDMAELLSGFGLLDVAGPAGRRPPVAAQRRKDDVAVTETVDEILLKSVLAETDGGEKNGTRGGSSLLDNAAQPNHGHVFNPSDSDVKTVDVNRIAKIVANIRLLADGNDTASLSQDAIQKKLENITADIAAIDDVPAVASTVASAGDGNKDDFDGYQVFFDDESKQAELPDGGGDLPLTPNAAAALPQHQTLNNAPTPPDPLSTDELQQLLDKNKNDVKRQEPAATVADDGPAAQVTEEPAAASTSAEAVRAQPSTVDSSSEAAATSTAAVVTQPQSSTEASSPSLSQLAESFGGGETASSIPSTVFETEAPREDRPRNGLYFYVDWNSFLTVNEGQKNQVNLRFAPKAGNPAHFLKVNVP